MQAPPFMDAFATLFRPRRRTPAPMPIIVGSPRSGTTLLRLMLDAHPRLTIPPETGFLLMGSVAPQNGETERAAFARELTSFPPDAPGWADFHLSKEDFLRRLERLDRFTPSEGFREFYRMYAERTGKPRWGDKTPMYGCHLRQLETLLPEACFIHLIRDGRDAAVSLRRQWFSPGDDITTQARFWRDNILATRTEGEGCRHYLEVRYEDLIREPATVLMRICSFIRLDFDRSMLAHHRQAAARVGEHQMRLRRDGSVLLTSEARRSQQKSSLEPPNPAKIGHWRQALSPEEQRIFADEAGELLGLLGYPLH